MTILRELYQEVIVDHSRNPRNFGELPHANCIKEGFNPLCGDKIKIYIDVTNNVIKQIQFTGTGCAISMASASLLSEVVLNKDIQEVETMFSAFHQAVTQSHTDNEEILGKLSVLSGVAEFPARVKCATLSWHTLKAALNNDKKTVSTE